MGVDVPILRDLLDLRKDVVEVLGPLEEPEAPRVHVREVEDGDYALRVFHEREDLVETPDDLLAAARLDPELRADLPFLVRVPDQPEGLRDPVQGLLRLQLAQHAE